MNRRERTLRNALDTLRPHRAVIHDVERACRDLETLFPPRVRRQPLAFRPVAPGKARAERRKTKAEARRSTRPMVEARADGRCEAATYVTGPCSGSLHWDHFFGRGKVPPSVELEWMLCQAHHAEKTLNRPSRAAWLGWFLQHAARHGLAAALARGNAALQLELAQHPEHRRTT